MGVCQQGQSFVGLFGNGNVTNRSHSQHSLSTDRRRHVLRGALGRNP